MRADEKQLEGPELERAVETEHEHESEEREQEELPQLAGEEVRDLELQHRSRIFDALRLIMDNEQLTVSLLGLPLREQQALEALQTAVSGKHVHMSGFVFAEDRKTLLEQALAVLQQNLTHGDSAELAELHGRYDELVERIGTLREELANLEDAQDDLFDEKRQYVEKKPDDAGDKDDEDAVDIDESANERDEVDRESGVGESASITDLVGAALLAAAGTSEAPASKASTSKARGSKTRESKAGSKLPESSAPDDGARASSLYGAEVPDRPPARSTLGHDDAPDAVERSGKPPLNRRGKRG